MWHYRTGAFSLATRFVVLSHFCVVILSYMCIIVIVLSRFHYCSVIMLIVLSRFRINLSQFSVCRVLRFRATHALLDHNGIQ
jgi:hypothetical protein